MKKLLIFLLAISSVHAQELTVGVRMNSPLGDGSSYADGQPILGFKNGIYFTNVQASLRTSGGIFARIDRKKSTFSAELNLNRYYLSKYVSSARNSGAYPNRFGLINPRIGYAYKPLPWLRLNASLGVNFMTNQKTDGYYYGGSELESIQKQLKIYENDLTGNGKYQNEYWQEELTKYEARSSFTDAFNKIHLDTRLGVGFDAGGFMIDFNYHRSLSPLVGDINFKNDNIPFGFQYDYFSLSIGYRILPLRKFLLAPRKNKTYEKQQSEIPFYKNEVSFMLGKEGEDMNSKTLYENSYTRYLRKRLGVSVGINTMQPSLVADSWRNYLNIGLQNTIAFYTEIKFLPLYLKKHRIGTAGGLNLITYEGLRGGQGQNITPSGTYVYPVYFNQSDSKNFGQNRRSFFGFQFTADYNYLLTKRMLMGGWLRGNFHANSNTGNFVTFGIKTGYLF